MTCHYPNLDRAVWEICFNQSEALSRSGYEISALVPQTSFGEETSTGRRLENVGCSRLEIITVNVTQFSPEPA